ncbi:hypothetical protein LTR05_000136 [Lithohypha guttulata]|uniref:DUF8035 domain-containing protein n=1 Tax=Lithohypha guttulata TaxID=1690604 RepID=A0AAN7T407_9EURO|nr:hypothetical protein LTR05_000136 [Lithohypha guttulata]
MTTHRTKAVSPTGPRIYLDTPRASTGTVLASSYDTRYDQRPIRASFSTVPSVSSSSRVNSVYETQPVSKKTYVDPTHSGGTISRTEYAVRARRDSASGDSRRPLSLVTKNVSPTRPEFTDTPREMTYSKQSREDPNARLLQPTQPRGSAHHQRHNSATKAETSRYFGVAAPRSDRSYHNRGPHVEKVADSRPVRYVDEPVVEYTGPREQFDRDYPRPRRQSLTRRERPVSVMDTKYEQAPPRRDTAPAPPSANRQLQRLERDDRKSGFESDPDRSKDHRRTRRNSRGPVVHQRDEGYSSARDEYDPRRSSRLRPYDDDSVASSKSRYRDSDLDTGRERERSRKENERPPDRDRDLERRERRPERMKEYDQDRDRDRERKARDYEVIEDKDPPRRPRRRDDRDASPEHSLLKTLGTAAVGGLAAAGIVNRKPKDEEGSDSDSKRERRHRRHRSRERTDDDRRAEDPEGRRRRKERRVQQEGRGDSSGSDTPVEATRQRPQSRTRRRRDTNEGHGSDREVSQLALPAPERRPSREPDPSAAYTDPARAPILDRGQQESPTNNEARPLSPGEGEDGRPRRVSIVEPVKDKKDDVKPKGILKKAREVPFPEDPNPTREGVAPLKQAGSEGIPPGARWTKVSRILVNPEALERAHERFEERDDYVIVLRVLSREEIEKLAEKTREIREQREREWQKQVEERRRRRAERGERDTEDEDGYDDSPREQLALEPPPSAPPVDLRQLATGNAAQQFQPQQQSQPQPAYAPQQSAYPAQQQAWQAQGYPAHLAQQQPYVAPQQQGYPPQHAPPPAAQQPTQQQQFVPGQWQTPRTSAEAIAATAPGQPLPSQQQPAQQQSQYDGSSYSHNV